MKMVVMHVTDREQQVYAEAFNAEWRKLCRN